MESSLGGVTFPVFLTPFLTLGFLSPPFSSSAQSTKRAYHGVGPRVPNRAGGRHHLWGRHWSTPALFLRPAACTQDSAVPPLTPPSTWPSWRRACRRLARVSKPQSAGGDRPKRSGRGQARGPMP